MTPCIILTIFLFAMSITIPAAVGIIVKIKKKILKKGMDNESKWEKNRKQMIKTIRGKKRFKRRVKFSDIVDVHIIKGGRRKKRRGK